MIIILLSFGIFYFLLLTHIYIYILHTFTHFELPTEVTPGCWEQACISFLVLQSPLDQLIFSGKKCQEDSCGLLGPLGLLPLSEEHSHASDPGEPGGMGGDF